MERPHVLDVSFFVGQEKWAVRRWAQIPRVGDEVMMRAGGTYPADAAGKASFRVVRVVWGVEAPDAFGYEQAVNIEVEPA